uniref:Uncharacterized protein n=1 Tax=Fusarium oxysporum (strain Fo5176) TaxID=660025 RepID=A0A0D2XGX0_FUSOF
MEAHRSTTESREPWPPIVDECFRFQGSRPIFYMYVCHGKWSRERHMEQGRAFRTLPLSEPPGHDIVSDEPRDHEWTAITFVRANTANLGPTMLDSSRASRIEKLALQPCQW